MDGPSAPRRGGGPGRGDARHRREALRHCRDAPHLAAAQRAALYYLLGRDEECLRDIQRTLELEPRHFAAMLHFGEILLGEGAGEPARYAFAAALTLHPHLPRAREALADKA